MRKNFLLTFVLFTGFFLAPAHASFQFSYGLNYESDKDSSSDEASEYARIYHKIFLGASINGNKTVFLGQNINSWSRQLKQGSSTSADYSLLELGPKLLWYFSQERTAYVAAEWNPYVQGDRTISNTSREVRGSSIGFSFGYRFKLSREVTFGASLNYTKVTLTKETVSSRESDLSDGISMIVPMLELAFTTR